MHIENLKDSRSRLHKAAQNPYTDVTVLRQDYYAYLIAFSFMSTVVLAVLVGVVSLTLGVVVPTIANLVRLF